MITQLSLGDSHHLQETTGVAVYWLFGKYRGRHYMYTRMVPNPRASPPSHGWIEAPKNWIMV